ncbi:Circadian clock protein kinase KaiC [Candidatus Norongarragalina meridionalis]|nr:Circadian clock protein kinase KaiC [Candidatus Norongarragalina meridionalis]
MERIRSGIHGLDELVDGGLPQGRAFVVKGAPGSGKSIFSMQFALRGGTEGEKTVFLTTEHSPKKLREDALSLGWNLSSAERRGELAIIDAASIRAGKPSSEEHSVLRGDDALDIALRVARRLGAKRLVVDTWSALGADRREFSKLAHAAAEAGITVIATSECGGEEEAAADGVFELSRDGDSRMLSIPKMRGTRHSLAAHKFGISEKGIAVERA